MSDSNGNTTPIGLLPCPFCGRPPTTSGRAASPAETAGRERYMHFVACSCGGFTACAYKDGCGNTPRHAERDAASKWNKRSLTVEEMEKLSEVIMQDPLNLSL